MADQAQAAVVPTGFSKVPLELLLRMTNDLTTREITNLRLTCRSIEIALFATFAREFFTKKQFMVTESSLTTLLDISRSRMGSWLKHVILGLDYYSPAPRFDRSAPQVNDPRIALSKYTDGLHSQQALLESGQAAALLSSAFAELSKKTLHTVGIRDFASELRGSRDGDGARWNSYGARTVLQETGVNLMRAYDSYNLPSGYNEFVRQVFRLVLQALGSAGATPSAIEVLRTQGGYLRPSAFYIPDYLEPTVLPMLQKLETIFLPVQLAALTGLHHGALTHIASTDPADPTLPVPTPCPDYTLRQFLGHLDNVKHLRLNLHQGDNSPFFRWLGETSDTVVPNGLDLPLSPSPARLPNLTELDLGYSSIHPKDILRILGKFAHTLKRLELWRICLDVSSDLQSSDGTTSSPVCLWAAFLKNVRAIPGLELTHLMIGDPMQSTKPSAKDPVDFKSLENNRPGTQRRSNTGNDVKAFIKDLEKDLAVRPDPRHSDSAMFGLTHDEDEDEDMSDSDSEDEDI